MSLSKAHYSPKVLVIPRKRWLRPNMTEKSFTGTLRINQPTNQLQPSEPKREITNITNSQNTKRTYGQPSEQLFPKRWPLSNPNRTKNNMNTRKVKRQRKTGNREPQQNYRLRTVSNELLVLRAQPHPLFRKWYKTLICSVRIITAFGCLNKRT